MEKHFLTTEDRKKAALPNTRKTFTVLAKGHNINYPFIVGAEVCGGRQGAREGVCGCEEKVMFSQV